MDLVYNHENENENDRVAQSIVISFYDLNYKMIEDTITYLNKSKCYKKNLIIFYKIEFKLETY